MDNLFVPGVILLMIVIRVIVGLWDKERIRDYIASRGGRVSSCVWAPFGNGWFGEKSDRIYEVRYSDAEGNEHDASCKTSMFTGVYFTEDNVIRRAKPETNEPYMPEPEQDSRLHALERENRRLRAELRRAQRGNSSPDDAA